MNRYLITAATVTFLGAGLSTAAMAQGYYSQGYAAQPRYDGYCYVQKQRSGRKGAVVGAVVGGLAGSQVSKNERGLGTVAGAVIGGAIGNSVGRGNVKCYDGNYYSYDQGYYDAPPAPNGYETVYFEQRPSRQSYRNIHRQSPTPPYPHGGYQHGGGPSYDIHARKAYRHSRNHPQVYGYETPSPYESGYYDAAPYGYEQDSYYQQGYEPRPYTPAPAPYYHQRYTEYETYAPYPAPQSHHYTPAQQPYHGGYAHDGYSQSGYYTQSQSSASTYTRSTRTYVNGVLVDQSSSESWRGPDGVWHEGPPPSGLMPF